MMTVQTYLLHRCDMCNGIAPEKCPNNSSSPWNSPEMEPEPDEVKWYAMNIDTRADVEVTELTWQCLPDDEDEAERLGKRYCRHEKGYTPDVVCRKS